MMALRWFSNQATDVFRELRVYELVIESDFAAYTQLFFELRQHGRVVMAAANQPGTNAGTGVHRGRFIFLCAPSVASRQDRLSVLYGTLSARLRGARVVSTKAAQLTVGAREEMWDAAASVQSYSVARLEELGAPTLSDRASSTGTAAQTLASQSAGVISSAVGAVGDAAGDAAAAAENTILYAKIALGIAGVIAVAMIATGGKPARLLGGK